MNKTFAGRLGVQQRVLPNYRVPFFDMLADACDGGLCVFAGQPRRDEAIVSAEPRRAQHVQADNFHILNGALYLCAQRGFTKWLATWDPDALIVEANPRYVATPAAVKWMHARGRRVIGWGLGAPPLSGSFRTARQARRRAFLNQFDALIAYSHRGAGEYAALGFAPERVFVAANAVAPRPARAPVHKPRPGDRATILFVGRLQERKHADFLLRACAQMPQPGPRLVIVGDGPQREALESMARQIYPEAEFPGAKHGDELKPYFLQADLFVLPGTGGLAVQEAMANGLPVIVAKGDGTQDDLVRAENGWQLPPGDYEALVNTMRQALADKPRLKKMGVASFRVVSKEINLEAMSASFVRALNSVSG